MNQLAKTISRALVLTPRYGYLFPNPSSQVHEKVPHPNPARPHSQANHPCSQRQTQQVRPRALECNNSNTQGVPITFNTHFRDEGGYLDVDTAIQVHEAIEREFGIEIKDRNILISDIETAFYVVTKHHDAV